MFAVFPAHSDFLGGKAIGKDELMSTINQFVRERGPAVSIAFPEQYPMLRTLQFARCGYWQVAYRQIL